MRQVRFRDQAGYTRAGEWTDSGIVEHDRTHDPETVEILAPVTPTKVLGVGENYHEEGDAPAPDNAPLLWLKGGPNVVTSHGTTVELPDTSEVVYEAELGVVIGSQCREIPPAEAMANVAGFTCVNDISNQDATEDRTFLRRKSFDNAAPLGPVLASPEDVPREPRVRLWLNGQLRQDSQNERFIRSIPEVVSAFSQWLTLEPEDVIMMGTPSGLGELHDGDHVEIEIEGIGRLEHDISNSSAR